MGSIQSESSVRPQPLASMASIMVRPRATMRAILDHLPDRMVIPLVLAATVAGSLGDAELSGVTDAAGENLVLVVLITIAGLLVGTLIALGIFYLLSWSATFIGRFLEGTGDARAVRSALAWGLVPIVWSLLYEIPMMLTFPRSPTLRVGADRAAWSFDPGVFEGGCAVVFVYVALELVSLAWWLTVTSNTLAEAHGFSAWKGLGTLLLTMVSPIIVLLAAILAAAT